MKRIVVAVVLSLIAASSFAQQSVVINVEITNLDVVVTDKQGKRVTGLTKDDFEILENGRKQEITNLSEMSRTTSTSTETIQPAPRRILFIVDNATIAFGARKKVFDATRATLEKLIVGPSDRIAVASLTNSVQERLGWTSEKAKVLETLATMEKDAILPRSEYIAFERSLAQIVDDANMIASGMSTGLRDAPSEGGDSTPGQGQNTGSSGRASARSLPQIDFQEIITAGRNYAANATTDTKRTLAALNAAFNSFAAMPGGRKIVILVGGGMPLNAAEPVFTRIENVRETLEMGNHPGISGQRTASTMTQVPAYDLTPQFDTVAASAKLKGVAIYAVNPEFGDRRSAGVLTRTTFDHNAEFALQKGMLDGYQRLALLTGGAAMIGRPADQVLTEIVNDLDSYYSIAYKANGPLDPKSRIEVKPVKKGLTARAVLASGAISRDWEVSDQVLANLVMEPANPLSISVKLDPAKIDGDKKTIPMKVLIPVNSLKLLQDGGEYAAAFTVFIALGDAGGNGSDPSRQEQTFRWPEAQVAQIKGKTIGFAVDLEVGADRDRVSVGVLDQYSGTAGYTRVSLE